MYAPQGSCTALVHILLRWPILIVGLGLTGAVEVVDTVYGTATPEPIISQIAQNLEQDPVVQKIMGDLRDLHGEGGTANPGEGGEFFHPGGPLGDVFLAIQRVEGGPRVTGVHPDGVSHGPAGLTREALEDLYRAIPDCRSLGYDEVLNDPQESVKFAYLYFLHLLHTFEDVDTAIVAYNFGPQRTATYLAEGKPLPVAYLQKVRARL